MSRNLPDSDWKICTDCGPEMNIRADMLSRGLNNEKVFPHWHPMQQERCLLVNAASRTKQRPEPSMLNFVIGEESHYDLCLYFQECVFFAYEPQLTYLPEQVIKQFTAVWEKERGDDTDWRTMPAQVMCTFLEELLPTREMNYADSPFLHYEGMNRKEPLVMDWDIKDPRDKRFLQERQLSG